MATRNTSKSSNFEPLDKLVSSTLKRNPKMELSKADLLKLLSYLEGELQAREVVIATLKAEKVKQLLYQSKHGGYNMADPLAALQRDAFAACSPGFDESSVRMTYGNQLLALEGLIEAQRRAHMIMREQLQESEKCHAKVICELEEEKRKHAQDTAQGDDVTYLLEKERERLKQEIEFEKQQNKKIEKELRKVVAVLEQDRAKQKQIVLLLLAERKRIIARLLEERRHAEELQQVLTLEKGRMADMVDGLEEESQKSLLMEAELERQMAQFDTERAQLRQTINAETERSQQLQQENQELQQELELLRQLQQQQNEKIQGSLPVNSGSINVSLADGIQESSTLRVAVSSVNTRSAGSTSPKPGVPPAPPAKPSSLHPPTPAKPASLTNISGVLPSVTNATVPSKVTAKVFKASSPIPSQPISEVRRVIGSSSPIPDGGSVSPPLVVPVVSTVTKTIQAVPVSSPSSPVTSRPVQGAVRNIAYTISAPQESRSPEKGQTTVQSLGPMQSHLVEKSVARITTSTGERSAPQVVQVTPRVSVSAGPGTKVFTSTQGGKVTFHVTTGATGSTSPQPPPPPQPPKKPVGVGRGVPPPVPPNKPVLTPQALQKKEVVARTVVPSSDSGQPIAFEVKPQKVGAQGVKFGITISKDKITVTNPEPPNEGTQAVVSPNPATDNPQVGGNSTVDPIAQPQAITPSMDLLGQELADFQQLLVSMVAGKGIEILAAEPITPANSQEQY